MTGFQFDFSKTQGGAPTGAPPQAALPPLPLGAGGGSGISDAQRREILMEDAFKKGGDVEVFEKGEYEKPGTYLERIEAVKFHTSSNERNGNKGVNFVICKRRVLRVLDDAKGLGAKVGDETQTVYKLSKSPAYNDCVLFMSKVSDINHRALKPADMVRACSDSQPFAGVCVITHRHHLPQTDEDKKLGRPGFLKCTYRQRVTADDLLSGNVPGMGGPLTQQEKDCFFGGKDPVDPLWITLTIAEQWVRASGAQMPSEEQKAAMTPDQAREYFTKVLAYYTENKGKKPSSTAV